MSVLVVGVSHRSAPVPLLERLALDAGGVTKLISDVVASEHVTEATVISTCNRLEIYADVDRFHGSIEEVSRLLVERAGESTEALVPHLYVHYDDGAVSHLFNVAAGLDSMVVGEGQILGQTRDALRVGQELGTVGPALNVLFQQALRVGKRSRAETDIDRTAPSLVTAALERIPGQVAGRRVVVVGAGSMASLAAATVHRMGASDLAVVNRTPDRAERLATEYAARPVSLVDLDVEIGRADVLISCTGAAGVLISRSAVEEARAQTSAPLAVIDLALPHDVDPAVAELPGVTVLGLAALAEELQGSDSARGVDDVRTIVAQEIAAFLAARRQASVTPTVVALRSMATSVVDSEMERLAARLPGLDDATRAEVLHTVRRVADKLLHEPTVRVKELANEDGAVSYAAALAELFALDPDAVDAVTRAEGISREGSP
ncbi:glutamyl-tRNA reductase [Nocardioides sp. Soil805]|uniref:glutamyl-tRNA reductase n=1 Tax=Nocardioides sp. Soil805 TaxID=1736416 RepID=UPI0007037D50|nr:glutamyl-tRNA reductase [Nocardioides sp. Soil805]KRF37151.1 glutamyl-tRNA reductase [Nocardioides sp. Soil805]